MSETAPTNSPTNPPPDPLPVAVIGCGRMGRNHARAYSQYPGARLVGVYDTRRESAQGVSREYGGQAFASIEELLKHARAVTIAVPTLDHLAVAEQCLTAGIACLIEKPLAMDAAQARRIVELSRRTRTPVQVGHIERFNPAVRALEKLALRPAFLDVVRISPMTFRSLDIGVVLDMMIHDIDIVLKLAASEVTQCQAVGVSVIGGVEDICNARLTFANGCVANLTASRLGLRTERRLRAFGRDAYVSLDYQKRTGVMVHRRKNLDALRETVARVRRGELHDVSQLNFSQMVQVEPLTIDDVEPLRAQAESFVEAVRQGKRPQVTAEDGLAAVELAARIVASMPPAAL